MKKFSLCILGMLLAGYCLFGQKITGKVMDSDFGPLQDVNIYQSLGNAHQHSNEAGQFAINDVEAGDTLFFSYLGYESYQHVVQPSNFDIPLVINLEPASFALSQVVVSNPKAKLTQISSLDLVTNPVNSSQEILQKVPGLFIAQHAGGGKAEQIFLRGFDIDHGTDIQITVDGMPVNMVSHAHGQGYADLHFVIPETIERIDFDKGPYEADKGNFATAGYVNFQTKDQLDNSLIQQEIGSFNTMRTLAMIDLLGQTERHDAYLAAELLTTDGPFESSQNFRRLNVMGKYAFQLPNDNRFSILASHFSSKWDASGQIPQSAIDQGLISRFGAIDDTEGGFTSRTNLSLTHTKILDRTSFLKTNAYFSQYNFELYSNFTFFLDDQENGDQIRQKEDRQLFGLESVWHKGLNLGSADVGLKAGIGLRYDQVNDVELSETLNRTITLSNTVLGDVNESNSFAFADANFEFGAWTVNPGIRLDYFQFDYVDALAQNYETLHTSKFQASPKLNIFYEANQDWQFYLKSGVGFHSNDSRVVVQETGRSILPAAYGTDLGANWKPARNLWINSALWYLHLQQEFVYVGDEGIVEPSGKTNRYGIDVGLRFQPLSWLYFSGDVNYTVARSIEEPEGANYIPLAPDLTSTGGINLKHPSGISGGWQFRYIKDRPANEDNSITAEGYFVNDLNLNYQFKRFNIGFSVENLFNVAWNEAQFATESRLSGALDPVEELHFTPGTPRFGELSLGFRF